MRNYILDFRELQFVTTLLGCSSVGASNCFQFVRRFLRHSSNLNHSTAMGGSKPNFTYPDVNSVFTWSFKVSQGTCNWKLISSSNWNWAKWWNLSFKSISVLFSFFFVFTFLGFVWEVSLLNSTNTTMDF